METKAPRRMDLEWFSAPGSVARWCVSVAAVALLLSDSVTAGVNSWTPVPIPGGSINRVVYHPTKPEIAYLAAFGGFYRSANGGASWQLIKGDFSNGPNDIAVDPAHPDRLFVAVLEGQVLTSNDAGRTFTALGTFPETGYVTSEIEIAADGSRIYVASGKRIFLSTNGGQTWQERASVGVDTEWITSLVLKPDDPLTLLAQLDWMEWYVSANGGASWAPVKSPPPGKATSLAFNPSNIQRIWAATTDGVWYSDTFGEDWTPTSMAGSIAFVEADPTDSDVIYAALQSGDDAHGLYRSSDGGVTWRRVQGAVRAGHSTGLAIHAVERERLLLVGSEGVWGSDDGGVVWARRDGGLSLNTVYNFSAAAGSDRIYFGGAPGGAYYLENGSSVAQAVNNEARRASTAFPAHLMTQAILAQTGEQDTLFVTGSEVAKSEDGGESWTLLNRAVFNYQQVLTLADSPVDAQVVLAGTFAGLFRSADGGTSWSEASGLPARSQIHSIVFSSGPTPAAYASVQVDSNGIVAHGIYKSVDDGQNWTAANNGIESAIVRSIAADPHSPETLYAATHVGLMKSTNAGGSWSPLDWSDPGITDANAVAVDPVYSSIVYAARVGRIARSVDSGQTWQLLREPQAHPLWPTHALISDPQRPHRIMVGTNSYGVQEISIEPDLALETSDAPHTIPYGTPVQTQYVVRNLGPYHATGAVATIRLPESATDVTAEASSGDCAQSSNVVTCSFPVFAAGASETIDVRATYPSAGAFEVLATLEAQQPDSAPANNSVAIPVTVAEVSDLMLTVSGGGSIVVGGTTTHTLIVENRGPNPASDVALTYQLAAGLTAGSITSTQGSCTATGNKIECTIGDLAVADSASVNVSVSAPSSGLYSSAAVVAAASESNPSDNNATLSTTVTNPPSSGGGGAGGGGGGGSASISLLLLLWTLFAMRKRAERMGAARA